MWQIKQTKAFGASLFLGPQGAEEQPLPLLEHPALLCPQGRVSLPSPAALSAGAREGGFPGRGQCSGFASVCAKQRWLNCSRKLQGISSRILLWLIRVYHQLAECQQDCTDPTAPPGALKAGLRRTGLH